jgi:hypothetical protein
VAVGGDRAADQAGCVRRIAHVGHVGLDDAAFFAHLRAERRQRFHVAPDGVHRIPRARGADGQGASDPG